MYINWNDINDFCFRFLIITGNWKLDSGSSLKKRIYLIYRILVWTCVWLISTIFQMIDIYFVRHDIQEISRNCRISTLVTTNLFFSLGLVHKYEYISDLRAKFKKDAEKITKNKDCGKIFTEKVKEMKYLNKIFFTSFCVSQLVIQFSPLLGLKKGKKSLPFREWIVFDLNTTWIYILVYASQIIVLTYTIFYTLGVVLMYFLNSVHILAQYKVLRHKVGKINEIWCCKSMVIQKTKEKHVLYLLKGVIEDHQRILS